MKMTYSISAQIPLATPSRRTMLNLKEEGACISTIFLKGGGGGTETLVNSPKYYHTATPPHVDLLTTP